MFKCQDCENSFPTMMGEREHRCHVRSTRRRRVACERCSRTFSTPYNLRRHQGICRTNPQGDLVQFWTSFVGDDTSTTMEAPPSTTQTDALGHCEGAGVHTIMTVAPPGGQRPALTEHGGGHEVAARPAGTSTTLPRAPPAIDARPSPYTTTPARTSTTPAGPLRAGTTTTDHGGHPSTTTTAPSGGLSEARQGSNIS